MIHFKVNSYLSNLSNYSHFHRSQYAKKSAINTDTSRLIMISKDRFRNLPPRIKKLINRIYSSRQFVN